MERWCQYLGLLCKRAVESVYESMERLHIDFIDLINVHDIEFADLNQVVNETLPALVELREKELSDMSESLTCNLKT